MFAFRSRPPLVVEVKHGRWDAYGHTSHVWHSRFLYEVLSNVGGVSDSVPDGTYHFNIKRRWFGLQHETTLLPVPAES
jgi:hypothetical protein